ncbi:hypothetical protein CEE37_01130 [candidate division LCP-89 bacterium B3_LCP]|uniref:DUF4397 domain-containing protein n=1 Tax=candidate division LCP-89 bacterium B3_LCP TaxID=2012998 RepID=A0A532V594_UNCL8|nr:MAG: hypothetical protein CEE37_01130 [candidate division LCP-89 bacterium B3_LCP]
MFLRQLFLAGSISCLILLCLSGCTKSVPTADTAPTPSGEVRFIHSAASTGALDFTYLSLDWNVYVSAVSDAVYGYQYGYYDFRADNRTFQTYLANTNIAVANVAFYLTDNFRYSVLAVDLDATINPELIALADTLALPPDGKAFLRFLHASADAPTLDILHPDSTKLVSELAQYDASPYLTLDQGTYSFSVNSSSSEEELVVLDPVTVISGNNYTGVLSGSIDGLPGPVFNIKLYQETSL